MAIINPNEQELLNRPQSPQQPQKKGSGTFTNLQSYLQANKGAGQQIVGNITQDVTGKQQKVTTGLGEVEKVGQAIAATKAKTEGIEGLVSHIKNVADTSGRGYNLAQRGEDIKFLTEGGYQTAADKQREELEAKSGVTTQAIGQVGQRAEQLGSEKGRYGLLSDLYRRPSYGSGQQRLDQLYLQQAGGSGLKDLQKSTANLATTSTGALQNITGTAQSNLAATLAQGAQGASKVKEAIIAGQQQLIQKQEEELAQAQQAQEDWYKNLSSRLVDTLTGSKGAGGTDIELTRGLINDYKTATGRDLVADLGSGYFGADPTSIENALTKSNLEGKDFVTQAELDTMKEFESFGGGQSKYTEAGGGTKKPLLSSTLKELQDKQYQAMIDRINQEGRKFEARTTGQVVPTAQEIEQMKKENPLKAASMNLNPGSVAGTVTGQIAANTALQGNLADLLGRSGFNPDDLKFGGDTSGTFLGDMRMDETLQESEARNAYVDSLNTLGSGFLGSKAQELKKQQEADSMSQIKAYLQTLNYRNVKVK